MERNSLVLILLGLICVSAVGAEDSIPPFSVPVEGNYMSDGTVWQIREGMQTLIDSPYTIAFNIKDNNLSVAVQTDYPDLLERKLITLRQNKSSYDWQSNEYDYAFYGIPETGTWFLLIDKPKKELKELYIMRNTTTPISHGNELCGSCRR